MIDGHIRKLELGKERFARQEEMASILRLSLHMMADSARSRLSRRRMLNDLDTLVAQTRETQQLSHVLKFSHALFLCENGSSGENVSSSATGDV